MELTITLPNILLCATLLYLSEGFKLNSKREGYNGFQVLRIIPNSNDQLQGLLSLKSNDQYDFWTEPRNIGLPIDIMAHEEELEALKTFLRNGGFYFEIFVSDVGILVNKNLEENEHHSSEFTWDAYHTYTEISEWMDDLASKNPLKLSVCNVGRSYERKMMKVAKLSKGISKKLKPAIWVEGGVHGREWISPAVVTYMLNELTVNPKYKTIISQVDFYFMPVVNPDSYEYTFKDNDTRLWKKTRSKTSPIKGCVGVDLDKNWSFHWNGTTGASPCSDDYPGKNSFSEKEIQIVRKKVLENVVTLKAFLTIQSYGQLWLYPWGYTTEPNKDTAKMANLSKAATNAIYDYAGTRYIPKAMCSREDICLYGNSIDWMKRNTLIEYPFQVVLPDMGNHAFMLPPKDIIPTAEETLLGLLTVANHVIMEFTKDLS